jgi:hypothetical protein
MAFLLVDALDTILKMTSMVYSCIELGFETEAKKAEDAAEKAEEEAEKAEETNAADAAEKRKKAEDLREKAEKRPSKDTFNVIFSAVDNGIIEIVSGLLAINWTAKETKIELSSLGELTIEASSMNDITGIEKKDAQTPTVFVEQVKLATKIARLVPDAFSFVKDIAVSPKAMADKAKKVPTKEGI